MVRLISGDGVQKQRLFAARAGQSPGDTRESQNCGRVVAVASARWRGGFRLLPLAGLASALLILAPEAHALECEADSECPKGFTCEELGMTACPGIDCADDDDCRAAAEAECTPQSYQMCVSIECDSDAECAEGMVCHTQSYLSCDGSCREASDGERCTSDDIVCEEQTSNSCIPRYQLPCEADADCGNGFSCVEQESCECSGSPAIGVEPEPDPADAPEPTDSDAEKEQAGGGSDAQPADRVPPEESDCSCEPSGRFACQLNIQPCSSDFECPDGFECGPNPNGSVCWDGGDGAGCSEPDPTQVCLPPYYNLGFFGRDSGPIRGDLADSPSAPAGEDGDKPEPSTANVGDIRSSPETSSSAGCQLSNATTSWSGGALSALGLLAFGGWISRRRQSPRARQS